jgi:hypothetical protein
MIEDHVWGSDRIQEMPPMKLTMLEKIPFIGKKMGEKIRLNPIAPYLGCPYSCSFCSISSLPKNLRKVNTRNPEDFIDELESYKKKGNSLKNRLFFFLPDNLLLGGKKLEAILDLMIQRKTLVNYAAQVSIEVAENDRLLDKLRRSGASHLFIGLESLNIKNLKHIGKNAVAAIEKSGLSVSDYYAQQIKKIQRHGISVHGAFILGLPHDYYNSKFDHSGHDIGKFCSKNRIGIQATPLSDLPGSRDFILSQKEKTYLFARQGTMDYLISLVVCDLTEGNRIPPETLKKSPLIVLHMAYEAINRVGKLENALKSAFYMMLKGFQHPTQNGRDSLRERVNDAFIACAAQLIISQYKEHADKVLSSFNGIRGSVERLYDLEKNPAVKKEFKDYVQGFIYN